MRRLGILAAVAVGILLFPQEVLAGQWKMEEGQWSYEREDGSVASDQWIRDMDGTWYYLDESGHMLTDAVTPDGYQVDEDGSWMYDEEQKHTVSYISSKKESIDYVYRIILTAKGTQGETVWTYTTDYGRRTGLYPVEYFEEGARVYVFENGTVTALDRDRGSVIWRNTDFEGVSQSHVFDSDGTLYLCGYHGPDAMAIDWQGQTLWREEQVHERYCWAGDLNLDGRVLTVSFDGIRDGNGKPSPGSGQVQIGTDGVRVS